MRRTKADTGRRSARPVPVGTGPTWRVGLALAVVFAVAAWLRLHQLGIQVALDDEWHGLHAVLHFSFGHIFLHFGGADHSIPLTLYYKALAETFGLGDWGLRLPSVVAGLALVIGMPWLLWRYTSADERILYTALLAVSPLLVHFSRFARPYALSTLLAVTALLAIHHWDRGRGRAWAGTYILATALAAWLHPLTLPWCGAAGLWVFVARLLRARRTGNYAPATRMLGIGVAALVLCAVLLAPPLWADWGALAGKTGEHAVTLSTLGVTWKLFSGTPSWWLALPMLVLTLIGAGVALRRDSELFGMMSLAMVVLAAVVVLLRPAWGVNGLTFGRYMLPAMPLLLWWMTLGGVRVTRWLIPPASGWWAPLSRSGLAVAALAGWVAAGSLPEQHGRLNPFMGHKAYVFDFDTRRNIYRRLVRDGSIPEVYRRIAGDSAPAGYPVIEVPWRYINHRDPLWRFQQVHGREVRIGMRHGLCVDAPPKGEYGHGDERVDLNAFVHLVDLLEEPVPARVVFHMQPHYPFQEPAQGLDQCVRAFRRKFGRPWHQSDSVIAFKIP